MIIAIPRYGESIAPCFEAASKFLLATVGENGMVTKEPATCVGCEGIGRVAMMKSKNVNVLICGGIKRCYEDMLTASGITVIKDIDYTVNIALRRYVDGLLTAPESARVVEITDGYPHEDLVCWSRELFEVHGYTVRQDPEDDNFPIDLKAETACPLCGKPVRVAICCGSKIYGSDRELKEFQRCAGADFHAKVYVHPTCASIRQQCEDFKIELLDPDTSPEEFEEGGWSRIPLLRKFIEGHQGAVEKKSG